MRGSKAGIRRGRLTRFVLAGEESAAERTVRHDADTEGLRHGYHLLFDRTVNQTVPRLLYHPRRKPVALRQPQAMRDLPSGKVGGADIAHFALLHQVVQCADGLFEGRGRVRDVEVVNIDVVGLQTPQRILDFMVDVVA